MKTKVMPSRRWVCNVIRSGFNNGAGCRSDEPHDDWDCGYRWELSLPDTPEVRAALGVE